MSETMIEVKNIGKKYEISHETGGYIALRDVFMNVLKSPFSFVKDKIVNKKEDFWAVEDINFTANKGEVIGIIGKNGAGKSTLLKILSQITPPTKGEIKLYGRVGSLLEVGTGFHPELTGRENIFLNGAILGMTKVEIVKKFEQIVEFAGVRKFLDTPVKHYSSGMYVRLAFSVAAHMEPDILIVDEVLAVGDAEFQKKSLGKMDEITREEGRTILFVSHNMAAMQNLCKKIIWLEGGKVKKIGPTREIIDEYTQHKPDENSVEATDMQLRVGDAIGSVRFSDVSITDETGSVLIESNGKLKISFKYSSDFKRHIPAFRVIVSIISTRSRNVVVRLDSHNVTETLEDTVTPSGEIICQTDTLNLVEGTYRAEITVWGQNQRQAKTEIVREFEVTTDISKYNYSLAPDKDISDYVIKHSFKQL